MASGACQALYRVALLSPTRVHLDQHGKHNHIEFRSIFLQAWVAPKCVILRKLHADNPASDLLTKHLHKDKLQVRTKSLGIAWSKYMPTRARAEWCPREHGLALRV